MNLPKKINLGSGKDFKPEYLNLDINDYWRPDITTDIAIPLEAEPVREFDTQRFGRITLEPDSFDEIIANDVLEHIRDLTTAMTNCLHLLKVDGVFNIYVPYDLSYGAWQDPTHVRAFNERSWLYYTEWFWYLGWNSHRFTLNKLDFVLSPIGRDLHQIGQAIDVITRTPRAVDGMQVTLKKITLSEQDHQTRQRYLRQAQPDRV